MTPGHARALERTLRSEAAEVQAVARRVTGRPDASLGEWSVEPLAAGGGGNPTSGGAFRVSGTATSSGDDVPWSAVLKVVRAPEDPESPHRSPRDPIYWRREVDAVQSGLLDQVEGIAAPRSLGVQERDGGRTGWLWLEDLGRLDRSTWTEDAYRSAARALARFHASGLAVSWADWPWLEREDFAVFLADACRPMFDTLLAHVDGGEPAYLPLARSAELRPLLDLVRDPGPVLRPLAGVPRTLCHNDLNPDNLLLRAAADGGDDELVAFDWQMVGLGSVSADLGQLLCYVPDVLDARTREEVEASVLREYWVEMTAAGVDLDPAALQAAYLADSAARQGMFAVMGLCVQAGAAQAAGQEERLAEVVAGFVTSTSSGPLVSIVRRAVEQVRQRGAG